MAWVPGAFEIPLVAERLARAGRVRRGDLPRRGDPRRDGALRPRRERGGARHRRGRAEHRRSPASSRCWRRRTSRRRRRAPAGRTATRDGRPPRPPWRWRGSWSVARRRRRDDRRSSRGAGRHVRPEPAVVGPASSPSSPGAETERRTTTGCATRCGSCSTPASRSRSGTGWCRPSRARSSSSRRRRRTGPLYGTGPGPDPARSPSATPRRGPLAVGEDELRRSLEPDW